MIRVNVTMEHLQVPSISCSVLTHASITWQHQCLVLVEVWVLIAGRERQQLLHFRSSLESGERQVMAGYAPCRCHQ